MRKRKENAKPPRPVERCERCGEVKDVFWAREGGPYEPQGVQLPSWVVLGCPRCDFGEGDVRLLGLNEAVAELNSVAEKLSLVQRSLAAWVKERQDIPGTSDEQSAGGSHDTPISE